MIRSLTSVLADDADDIAVNKLVAVGVMYNSPLEAFEMSGRNV